jgi:hypothetical protein
MLSFKKELIALMNKHKSEGDVYINPYLIVGILNSIEKVDSTTNLDDLYDWAEDMYSR